MLCNFIEVEIAKVMPVNRTGALPMWGGGRVFTQCIVGMLDTVLASGVRRAVRKHCAKQTISQLYLLAF